MPPTPSQNSRSRTRATPYQTQASPGATLTSENTAGNVQRFPGRAKGLQGYSTWDCKALVEAVQAFLPLGAQEWNHVQQRYNSKHAEVNGQESREVLLLKNKFCALVNFSKPTGNPSCPDHVQDERKAQKAIDARAHVVACSDVEEDTSSDG